MKKIKKMTLKSSWHPKCRPRTLAALCLLRGSSLVILGLTSFVATHGGGAEGPAAGSQLCLEQSRVQWDGRGAHFRAGQEPGFGTKLANQLPEAV